MKKKIIGILIIMLMISSALTTILFSDDGAVKANEVVNLDYDYIWDEVQYFANVIHNVNWSENGENGIPKGRSWATAGENYTINEILELNINGSSTPCGLTNYTLLPIGYVSGDRGLVPGTKHVAKKYSTKIVIQDYSLTLENLGVYPDQYIPYSELFPYGIGVGPNLLPNLRTEFSSVPIRDLDENPILHPFKDASDGSYLNISTIVLNNFPAILRGTVKYIADDRSLPENQSDIVFLMNETSSCETKIQNITEEATGCILIHDKTKGYNFTDAEYQNCSFTRINCTETNLSLLLNDLANGSEYYTMIDFENHILNFFNLSYNLNGIITPWVGLISLNNESDPGPSKFKSFVINQNINCSVYNLCHPTDRCKGIIIAGPGDSHFMLPTVHDWGWFNCNWSSLKFLWGDVYFVPMFSVNASIAISLRENISTATVSGFIDQELCEQKEDHPGVESYNVVAYRNISHSPDDKIVVLSNRIDGWFSEAPGDSGVGGAILLGIAKNFKDNNITPKYNLTFLFTTGEEYGMRGAQHFVDTHPNGTEEGEYNYIHWIGFDQLGFTFTNTRLETNIAATNETMRRIIEAIANDTDYLERTNNSYGFNVTIRDPGGAEDLVWMNNCPNTILFEKNHAWDGWHRAGNNYTEGDSMEYINRTDVNVTFELVWNVTKYFTVNPDCSLDDVTFIAIDSPNDGDTLADSLMVNFSIDSILPSDKVMVNVSLCDEDNTPVLWMVDNYTTTTLTGINHNLSYTFTLPVTIDQGFYTLQLRLYNSTGRINKIINSNDDIPNEIQYSDSYYLYHPFGYPTPGELYSNTEDAIRGSYFTANEYGTARNITAYVQAGNTSGQPSIHSVCMIYRKNDNKLIGRTEDTNPVTGANPAWVVYNFTEPYPVLEEDTEYVLVCWSEAPCYLYYDHMTLMSRGRYNDTTYGSPPDPIVWDGVNNNLYSIYCGYRNDTNPPWVTNVSEDPHIVGFGGNVTISTDVVDNESGVKNVTVIIGYPGGKSENQTMNLISGDTYQYVFDDAWLVGQYNYSIWAMDNYNNSIYWNEHGHFHISADVSNSIATLQDSYSGSQYINITDPPNPPENYTLVDRGSTWDSYYDATTGQNILEVAAGPINYQENGIWTPINNTLNQLAENHPAYVYGYRSGNNRGLYGAYFKSNAQQEWPVAFTYNNSDDPTIHAVRSKLVGVGYVDPQSNWAYQYLQNVQSSQGQINENSIIYPGVFTGTDVTWSYGNTGLKEEILLSNTTKTVLQNHPPSQYGLNNASSYLVFITKLEYQNLNLYNGSGMLNGNVTVSDAGIDLKDVLGQFKCALPLSEAYELNNQSARQKLTYRIIHLNGNTYLLSGLKVTDLNAMTFPVVVDPTLSVNSHHNDGFISSSSTSYNTAWGATSGAVDSSSTYLTIGQKKAGFPISTYYIYRGFVLFNTSALPSNAYIDSAILSLYKKDDYSTTDFTITVQNGQPTYPHNPLQTGDYDKGHYSGNGGSLNTVNFVNGRNNISITELGWINETGWTKFCLRSSRDISGTAPTSNEYVNVYSTDAPLQAYVPKLIITYRNQSKIKNTGDTDIKGYLLIQVQYYNSTQGKWLVDKDTINETTARTITSGSQLALDTIFNGHVRASDLTHGIGTYRVYVAFRDPDGNILRTNDGTELEAWWQFSKT
jgi:hypothetical protein